MNTPTPPFCTPTDLGAVAQAVNLLAARVVELESQAAHVTACGECSRFVIAPLTVEPAGEPKADPDADRAGIVAAEAGARDALVTAGARIAEAA